MTDLVWEVNPSDSAVLQYKWGPACLAAKREVEEAVHPYQSK